jgi:hypothetical protein
MKKLILTMVLFTTILFGASVFASGPPVFHIGLIDLKEGVTPEQIEECIIVTQALISKIPGVLEVSINKKAIDDRDIHIKDYDVGLFVKWENLETGKVYGPHILHKTWYKLHKPLIESIKVIDFYGN